jgi:hypothetical protein
MHQPERPVGAPENRVHFTAMNPRWDTATWGGPALIDRQETTTSYDRDSIGGKVLLYPLGENTPPLGLQLERTRSIRGPTTASQQSSLLGRHTASVASATHVRDTTNGGSPPCPPRAR